MLDNTKGSNLLLSHNSKCKNECFIGRRCLSKMLFHKLLLKLEMSPIWYILELPKHLGNNIYNYKTSFKRRQYSNSIQVYLGTERQEHPNQLSGNRLKRHIYKARSESYRLCLKDKLNKFSRSKLSIK